MDPRYCKPTETRLKTSLISNLQVAKLTVPKYHTSLDFSQIQGSIEIQVQNLVERYVDRFASDLTVLFRQNLNAVCCLEEMDLTHVVRLFAYWRPNTISNN